MLENGPFQPVDTDMYLAAVLTGCQPKQPRPDVDELAREIRNNGVDGLAAATPDLWPSRLASDLKRQAVAQQFWEDQHKTLVSDALDALHDANVPAMVIKGTACAYSVYRHAWTRTRGDSDIVINPKDRATAISVLEGLGYAQGLAFSTETAVSQVSLERAEPGPGFSHVIDLHWQLNNSEVLSQLVRPDELLSRAVPLPQLSARAMGPDPADALLITCLHRYVHRASPYTVEDTQLFSEDRMIWLMDIHLLSQVMSANDWAAFQRRAERTGFGPICASGLAAAQTLFDTDIPEDCLNTLRQGGRASPAERYLMASPRGRWVRDFWARRGLRDKLAFLRAHLFPSVTYMRASFAKHPEEPLPALYLRRLRLGVARRFQQARAE